jgi:hypothetical protein
MVVFPLQGLTLDRLQRASAPTCSPGKLGGELRQRNYPEEAIGKILGGNLLGSCARFCQNHLFMPK